jgi:type II secretory ATPase GspE/PulE/Tfp pilus assembly ATPase PilB-like protein
MDKTSGNQDQASPAGDAAPEVLERLIRQAEQAGASDIHLHMRGPSAEVCFRLDGVLTTATALPAPVAERVCGRVKFLARLKTYQDSLPQDGRIDRQEVGAQKDIRVATYPTVTGEKIVLRLFNSTAARSLDELGLPAEACSELERFLRQTSGLLLLTGPAGSGKTTTIYACLRSLAESGGRHVITVEDPAEQIVPGVMQTEVNEARGLDFARAARHLLRQDPQVLVIGEIRDEETANIAVRAALTGHLVISTLHAGSCQGVFERLLVLCRDDSAVAASAELVLNQRLVRRLCPACQAETADRSCSACLGTGFRGRLPLVEWLRVNDQMRRGLAAGSAEGLAARPSLTESAQALLRQGLTNQTELNRALGF